MKKLNGFQAELAAIPADARTCERCGGKQFHNRHALVMHVVSVHQKRGAVANGNAAKALSEVRKGKRLKKTLPKAKGRVQCPECPRKFKNAHGLSVHMAKHSPSKSERKELPASVEVETITHQAPQIHPTAIHIAQLHGAIYERIRLYCEGNDIPLRLVTRGVAESLLRETRR